MRPSAIGVCSVGIAGHRPSRDGVLSAALGRRGQAVEPRVDLAGVGQTRRYVGGDAGRSAGDTSRSRCHAQTKPAIRRFCECAEKDGARTGVTAVFAEVDFSNRFGEYALRSIDIAGKG